MTKGLLFTIACIMAVGIPSCVHAAAAKFPVPYAVGNHWEYSFVETDVLSVGESPRSRSETTKTEGIDVIDIASIKERRQNGDVVYLERENEKSEKGENTDAGESGTESLTLVSQTGIYTLSHRSWDTDVPNAKWQKYDAPLLDMPPDLSPGKKWKVGILRNDNLSMPIDAQVLGLETVTVPAGTFKDCLKICGSSSRMSGSMQMGEEQAVIKSGKSLDIMWVYPGLGVVKEEIITQMKMVITPKGSKIRVPVLGTRRETKELRPGYKIN